MLPSQKFPWNYSCAWWRNQKARENNDLQFVPAATNQVKPTLPGEISLESSYLFQALNQKYKHQKPRHVNKQTKFDALMLWDRDENNMKLNKNGRTAHVLSSWPSVVFFDAHCICWSTKYVISSDVYFHYIIAILTEKCFQGIESLKNRREKSSTTNLTFTYTVHVFLSI